MYIRVVWILIFVWIIKGIILFVFYRVGRWSLCKGRDRVRDRVFSIIIITKKIEGRRLNFIDFSEKYIFEVLFEERKICSGVF